MQNIQDDAVDHLTDQNASSLQDKSDHLERPLLDPLEYPTNTVIKKYLLMGGPIGGLLLWPLFAVMTILEESVSIGLILDIVLGVISLAVGGLILGFVPALITGIIIGTAKLYFNSVLQAMVIFFIGFTSTLICLFVFTSDQNITRLEGIALTIATVGGLSAVVCGRLFVPKSK